MPIYAVQYFYSPDKATQDENRAEHRTFLRSLVDAGYLLASGPLVTDEFNGALLIFQAENPQFVEETLHGDPFQQLNQVEHVVVTEWNALIGPAFAPWRDEA